MCYDVSIADSVYYNKLCIADMLQSDLSLGLHFQIPLELRVPQSRQPMGFLSMLCLLFNRAKMLKMPEQATAMSINCHTEFVLDA